MLRFKLDKYFQFGYPFIAAASGLSTLLIYSQSLSISEFSVYLLAGQCSLLAYISSDERLVNRTWLAGQPNRVGLLGLCIVASISLLFGLVASFFSQSDGYTWARIMLCASTAVNVSLSTRLDALTKYLSSKEEGGTFKAFRLILWIGLPFIYFLLSNFISGFMLIIVFQVIAILASVFLIGKHVLTTAGQGREHFLEITKNSGANALLFFVTRIFSFSFLDSTSYSVLVIMWRFVGYMQQFLFSFVNVAERYLVESYWFVYASCIIVLTSFLLFYPAPGTGHLGIIISLSVIYGIQRSISGFFRSLATLRSKKNVKFERRAAFVLSPVICFVFFFYDDGIFLCLLLLLSLRDGIIAITSYKKLQYIKQIV